MYMYVCIYFFFPFGQNYAQNEKGKTIFFKYLEWDRLTLLSHISPSTPLHPSPVLPPEILVKIDEILHM